MCNVTRGMYGMLAALVLVLPQCDRNMAGSVTQTGNVTGKVIVKETGKPVAGARITLFKRETVITSPEETFLPQKETYTDRNGAFSLDVDDGSYSIIASDGIVSAFISELIPGTEPALGMSVALQKPGTLRGSIDNALELRGSGSVVVHLLGTDIYQIVDNSGSFVIKNVPAGVHTLVSYSTYLPEFSPVYQAVTIEPDSVSKLSGYKLTYSGIPVPRGVTVAYDTSKQLVTISWQPVAGYDDFQEYGILRGVAGTSAHELRQIAYTDDTMYRDRITFTNADGVRYEYAVCVNNKLGQTGQYYGIYPVNAVPYQSPIDAGADQVADIGTEVHLSGAIAVPKSPVVKMEWKIGSSGWKDSDSGKVSFTTTSTVTPDTTACIFRVTDSMGNAFVDTARVFKQMLIKNYGLLPSLGLQAPDMVPCVIQFKGKYWYISGNATESYHVWSSEDLSTWKLENAAPPMSSGGNLVVFKDKLFCINLRMTVGGSEDTTYGKSYSTSNGVDWSEIAVSPPPISSDSLIITYDSTAPAGGSSYHSYYAKGKVLSFHDKLYSVMSVTIDKGSQVYYTMQCLITSSDGIAWTFVGSAPVGDYRFSFDLFTINDNLYFVSIPGGLRYTEKRDAEVYVSSDEGRSWKLVTLWDSDPRYPDDIYFITASDSILFARYYEKPQALSKEVFFINGTWNYLPLAIVNEQQGYAQGIPVWLDGNRYYWIDNNYYVKSVKLF